MNTYKFVLDEVLGQFLVYKDGSVTPALTVPYFAYGTPFVAIDSLFSISYCSSNGIDIIYQFADYTTIKNYKFELNDVFNSVEVGTFLDLGIWNNSYTTELFWATKNILGTYQGLIETYLTFDILTAVATGLTYTDIVTPIVPSCLFDTTSIMAEFEFLKAQNLIIQDKLNNLSDLVIQDNLIDVSTLDTTPITLAVVDVLNSGLSNFIADASLNGYGCEFKDGISVVVSGRDVVYVVQRSFFSIYSENAYTIHYDIKSLDGQRLIVPEALLTKYVPPVV